MTTKSVTTLCFRPFPLQRALEGVALAGFTRVEICAIKGWTEHVSPDDISPATVRRVRQAIADAGLTAVSVAGHGDLAGAEGLDRHLRLVDFTAEIGAKYLNSFAGDHRSAAERAKVVESARKIGDRARELDLQFCLENDGNEAGTGAAVARLVEEIGHERVGIVYDAANAVFAGGVDPVEDLRKALPRTQQVHVKDQRGGQGANDFPPLGEGEVDWPDLLRALGAYGFSGPRCLEIEFDGTWPGFDECVAAVARSRQHWERTEAAA